MKRLLMIALLAAFALPASAQFAKPEDAIKYRRSGMTMQGAHLGRLGAMVNGRVPFDARVAAENAEALALLLKLSFGGFVEGSDKGDTKAKPAIWAEADKFRAAAGQTQEEAAKLLAAARAGDEAQLKAAFGATARTCKACHDTYREQ